MNKLSLLLKKKFVPLFSLVFTFILSLFVLYTPAPKPNNDPLNFSAVRAQEHLAEITKKPHSYYDREAHEEVRSYLVDTLASYFGAANVHEQNYLAADARSTLSTLEDDVSIFVHDIENVMGVIPGTNPEGIMLVSHYDSRGHVGRVGEQGRSYGAMDDGYGVSTMLEIAHLLKGTTPTNSIYFLFTDAEEVGLVGARMAAQDSSVMDPIRFVINLESRGRYGPSYMFETSGNNAKVMDLYSHAKYPVTYSIATAVYSIMPNFTDFTAFIDKGLPGINFATLAGLDNYHSPLDTYELINLSSIQHMGEQVLPIVKEFSSNAKYISPNYFNASSDDVFFTFLPGLLIRYSSVLAIIFAFLVLVAFVLLTLLQIKQKAVESSLFTKSLPRSLLTSGGITILALLFSNVVAFLAKVPFKITYTRVSGIDVVMPFVAAIFLALTLYLWRKINKREMLLLSTGFNVLLTLVTTFVLPGASFLFLISSVGGLLSLLSLSISKDLAKHIVLIASYFMNILVIIPLLFSLHMALTVGGFVAVILLFLINAGVTLSTISLHFDLPSPIKKVELE